MLARRLITGVFILTFGQITNGSFWLEGERDPVLQRRQNYIFVLSGQLCYALSLHPR